MDSIYPSTATNPIQSTLRSSEVLPGACLVCSKIFKNVQLRNRHIKRIHKLDVSIKKMNHIVCPLCEQETNLKSHENLRKHLEENHQMSIELITLEFSSEQEYETWKYMQKIETSYAKHRIVNREEHKMLYYECNRSDAYGYKPNYKVRTEKSGGSIRIKGVCPSRLVCKLRNQGQVSVSYWKTHVGHNEELRTMHLSKAEEKMIVEKVTSGVPHSRILEDSRKMETPKLGRLPLLTSIDLRNLSRKYNIHKKPDQNDMVATDLKVKEWNDNKNYVLLLKMEDDAASCLGETSIIKLGHEEEINDFVRGKLEQRNVIQEETKEEEEILRLQKEELKNFIDELDNDSFTKFMRNIQGTMCKMKEELQEKARNITKKRKMEKQYFVRIKKFKNCSLVFYLVCNSYFKGRNVLESCGRDSGTLEILIKN